VGVSWRLAQGPIDLGWIADRVRATLAGDAAVENVSFDGLALAWEGFAKGADHPLDLRVSNLVVADSAGRRLLAAPSAHVTLSLAGLLLGRLVPRAIEVDRGEVMVTREPTGQINLGWGQGSDTADADGFDLGQLREQIAHPASSDHGSGRGEFDQIRRAHFRDTAVAFRDRGSGLTVHASDLDVDLRRTATGRFHGSVQGRLAVGGEQASVWADAEFVAGRDTTFNLRISALRPAGIAGLPPDWTFITGLDVPVAITAGIALDAAFRPTHLQLTADLGEGHVQVGKGVVPLRGGAIALSGTTENLAITKFHLDLTRSAAAVPTAVDLNGSVARVANRLTAALTMGIAQLDVADLPRLWPVGIAGGARPWVTEHITGGLAANATASFVIEADAWMRDVVLTKATANLDVSNGTFTWLDSMPPVEQAVAHLHLVDPDTLDIHLLSGRQKVVNRAGDLVIKDGTMRINGMSMRDQIAQIHAQVDGPVTSALALLNEPRLHLLSAHPIGLAPAGGDVAAALDFQFPLENKLRFDDVQIHAAARLTHVRVPAVVANWDLEDGAFDLSVDKDGLGLRGRAALAAMPVTLDGTMDFTPGLPDQIVQRIALSGKPDAAQLDAAGLPVTAIVAGPVAISAVLVERRSGEGSVTIAGDLAPARLDLTALGWSKPAGLPASATATLLMSHDRPVKLDRITVSGDGLAVTGSAIFSDGHVRSIQLDTIRVGRTQGHGAIHIGDEIGIVLQGSQIDLAPKLLEKTAPSAAVPEPALVTTPPWKLDARFDRAFLANGENATDLLANATGGGKAIRLLDALGTVQGGGAFSIRIEPRGGKRHLVVEAKDAGRFLRGLDAIRTMQSGHLTIDGTFDSAFGLQPLAGTAVIDAVVVHNSQALGKLLQAITLYGLVDVLRGPGISFSRIVAPYQYDGSDLTLNDARAANPSLGLTAQGQIGLASGQIAITGTIVPAYFFNAMLGQLPLVGKLFSPEKGGGVFAARFALNGPIDDPGVSFNPISALAPGFLRDIFGIFDKRPAPSGAPPKIP
jgi:hypothetical protein